MAYSSTKTYLQIVNDAIQEAGVDLASFAADGSDFNSNTNAMLNRFKVWTTRAWKDIQQEAYDWQFMSEQAVVDIDPGFMFYTTDGSSIAQFIQAFGIGSTVSLFDQNGTQSVTGLITKYITDLTATSTLAQPYGVMTLDTAGGTQLNFGMKPGAEYFTNTATLFSVPVTWVSSAPSIGTSLLMNTQIESGLSIIVGIYPVAYIGTSGGNANFQFTNPADAVTFNTNTYPFQNNIFTNTVFNLPPGNTTLVGTQSTLTFPRVGTITGYVHSWKSFNFNNDEENQNRDFLEQVQEIDFNSFRITDYYSGAPTGEVPLSYIPWEVFRSQYDLTQAPPGMPRIVTQDDTGRWKFYPQPYYTVTIKFDYVRTPQILANYNDTIRGLLDDFVDIIMWRTVMYYGEYDEQPSVALRATKNYKERLFRLELKNRQKFHFRPHRMW